MFRWAGAGALTILTVIFILVVVAIPLFLVYRSSCPEGGDRDTRYNIVLPWDDPPKDCRDHQQGFEVVKDEVGL